LNHSQILIAHRGESFDAPENTLTAINLAWQRNDCAVEIDVRLSLDKNIVVIHDDNTKRIGNQNKKVKNTLLKDLKKITVGNTNYPNEKIPTLAEALATVPTKKKLIIEIKCGIEIIDSIKSEINNSKLDPSQIEFISFELNVVKEIKSILPRHKVLWLLDLDYYWYKKFFSFSIEKNILIAKANNLDGLDLWASKIVDASFVDKIKNSELLVYLWTVNDPLRANNYFNMGVDGITTDRAQWMREQIKTLNL